MAVVSLVTKIFNQAASQRTVSKGPGLFYQSEVAQLPFAIRHPPFAIRHK